MGELTSRGDVGARYVGKGTGGGYRLGPVTVYGEHEADPGGLSIRLLPFSRPGAYPWWSETTAQMLEALANADIEGRTVLDFGCGAAAILAIAAEKMGAAEVVACEIHPEYAEEAKRQIEANGLDIPVVTDLKRYRKKFDFAVVNVGDAHLVGQVSKRARHGVGTAQDGELISW